MLGDPGPESRKAHRARPWLRRIGTWALTIALLGYVFYAVPLGRTWEAARSAGPAVVAVTLGYFLYSYAADVLATWATFRWYCAPLPLREVVAIRGATYLLAVVNYNLGQGGIVYVVGRKQGVGLARATGTVLLTMGVMLVALLVLAGAGSVLGPAGDPRLGLMRLVCAVGLALFVAYLAVIAVRPARLASWGALGPLFDAGLRGHAAAWLVRFPHVAGHVLFQWWLLRLFRVDISLAAAATLLPVIFVIGWLPITVQGLGTQQLAAMELLGPYVVAASAELQHARVVAFSLTLSLLFTLCSVLTGLLWLGRVWAELTPAAPSPADAAAERSASRTAPASAGPGPDRGAGAA
ncbi:MAG: flippase-like domain-containing protein [Deltaproteobacteria bacterium]|nr:flippase-like domain-containing protein [Deltaproteobacteria bacterium]